MEWSVLPVHSISAEVDINTRSQWIDGLFYTVGPKKHTLVRQQKRWQTQAFPVALDSMAIIIVYIFSRGGKAWRTKYRSAQTPGKIIVRTPQRVLIALPCPGHLVTRGPQLCTLLHVLRLQ